LSGPGSKHRTFVTAAIPGTVFKPDIIES